MQQTWEREHAENTVLYLKSEGGENLVIATGGKRVW